MQSRGSLFIASVCLISTAFVHTPISAQPVGNAPFPPSIFIAPQPGFVVPLPTSEAHTVAVKGKKTMQLLVGNNDQHARELGFTSAAEANDAITQLGVPFPIIRVNFEKLRTYDPKIPPVTLLIATTEFIYPITVYGQVRSSLTVTEVRANSLADAAWRTTEWGTEGLIRALDRANRTMQATASSFDLEILELGRFFLGEITGEHFLIIPIYDEPRLGFQTGVPLPAEVVFQKLVSEANTIAIVPNRRR